MPLFHTVVEFHAWSAVELEQTYRANLNLNLWWNIWEVPITNFKRFLSGLLIYSTGFIVFFNSLPGRFLVFVSLADEGQITVGILRPSSILIRYFREANYLKFHQAKPIWVCTFLEYLKVAMSDKLLQFIDQHLAQSKGTKGTKWGTNTTL